MGNGGKHELDGHPIRHFGTYYSREVLAMRVFFIIFGLFVATPASAFDAMQLSKFKAVNQCNKCDLSGANFSVSAEMASSGPDLSGARLIKANLRGANLSGTNLSKANLSDADVSYSKLIMTNLNGANLRNANLGKADLTKADLHGADLTGADLSAADLTGAKIKGAILCKTRMPWGEDNSGCQK